MIGIYPLYVCACFQVSLNLDSLYEKIVVNRRGGFCFEVVTLFAWLLQKMSYRVRLVLANVWRNETPSFHGSPTHLFILASCPLEDTTWLLDVSEPIAATHDAIKPGNRIVSRPISAELMGRSTCT